MKVEDVLKTLPQLNMDLAYLQREWEFHPDISQRLYSHLVIMKIALEELLILMEDFSVDERHG